jgi:uncharacterized protein YpmS
MSTKAKIDRALYGPSWTEVIFGAILSFALGIVLAIVFLILKPVAVVKELPKEDKIVRNMVYFIQGSNSAKGRTIDAKLKDLAAGKSVSVNEDELNSLFGGKAAPAPAPKAAPAKAAAKKADEPPSMPANSAPNFRIVGDKLQIGLPTTIDLLGLNQSLVVVATGHFGNQDGKVSYEIDDFQVGSLPASRLPYIQGAVVNKVLAAQNFPEELTGIWGKLKSITIEGSELKLTMP